MVAAVAQDRSALIAELQTRIAAVQKEKAELAAKLSQLEARVMEKYNADLSTVASEKQRAIERAYNAGEANPQIPSSEQILSGVERLKNVPIPDPFERQPQAAEATAVDSPLMETPRSTQGDSIAAAPDAAPVVDNRVPLTFGQRAEVNAAKVGKFIENAGEGVYNMVAAIPQILFDYYTRPDNEKEREQTAQQYAESRLGVSKAEYEKIKAEIDPEIDQKITWLKLYDKGNELVTGEPVVQLAGGQFELLKNMVTSPLETFYNQPVDVALTILGGYQSIKGLNAPPHAPQPKYIPKAEDPHGYAGVSEVVPTDVLVNKAHEVIDNVDQMGVNNTTFGINKQIQVLEEAAKTNPELRVELDALKMIRQRLDKTLGKSEVQAGEPESLPVIETPATPPVKAAQPTDAEPLGSGLPGKVSEAKASEVGVSEKPLGSPADDPVWENSGVTPDQYTVNNFTLETPGDPLSIVGRHSDQPITKMSFNPKTGEFVAVPSGQLHASTLRGKKFDDFVRLVYDRENNTVGSRAYDPNYSGYGDYDRVASFDGQWRAFQKLSKNHPGLRWVFDADEFITSKGDEVFDASKVPADRIRVAESKPSDFVIGVTAHKEGLQIPGSAVAAFDQPHMVDLFERLVFDALPHGSEVVARRPQLGIWGKYEPSFALQIKDSIEAVRAYAAKLGKEANNQDAVVIADASKGGKDMFEFQLPKRLTPALLEKINTARENAGIVAGSVDLSSGKLRIYDIFGDVKDKVEQFADEIGFDAVRHDVYSELIENSQYDQYIKDWESINARRKAESAQAQQSAGRDAGRTGALPQGESGRASGLLREESKVLTPDAAAKLGRKLERQAPARVEPEASPETPEGSPSGYPAVRAEDSTTPISVAKEVRSSASSRKLTASDVREYIRRVYGTPQRHGKTPAGSAGAHWMRAEVTRFTKGWARDLGVIAHELGHNIETAVWGAQGRRSNLPPYFAPFREELVALGKALYGSKKPNGGYAREGFAEYIRKYLNDETPEQAAPNFHKFFTENIVKNNDFIASSTAEIKSMIADIKKSSATDMLKSMIDFSGGKRISDLNGEDLRTLYHRSIINFWDTNHVFDVAEKTLGRLGIKINNNRLRPSELARYVEKSAQGRAYAMVMDGVYDFAGNKIGKGLKEIMDEHKFKGMNDPEFQDAITYAVAKHISHLRNKNITQGVDRVITDEVIAKHRDKWDGFAKDLTGWFNNSMRYLTEPGVGMMTPEAYQTLIESNPFYVPLMKVFEEAHGGATGGSGGGRFTNLKNPVKRISGSDRDIRNVVGQAFEKVFQLVAVADKSRVFNAVVQHATKAQGYGKLIEEIPPDKVASTFGLGKLSSGVEKTARDVSRRGFDIEGEQLHVISELLKNIDQSLKDYDVAALVTLYSNAKNYFGKEPIAIGWSGGKPKFYYVDPFLYDALAGLDNVFLPKMVDLVFGAPARAERLGRTGANISFGMFNTIRDSMTYLIQGDVASGKNPLTDILLGTPARGGRLAKAIQEEFSNYLHEQWGIGKKDLIAERMRATAVTMSQILGSDMNNLKSMRSSIDKLFTNDTKARALGIVKHPLEAIREIVSITEMAPRRAAYKEVLKKMGELEAAQNGRPVSIEAAVRAANAANEVTLNFKRMGATVRALNQITPFFNATIQGPARMMRELRHNPQRAIPRAIASITLPTMLLWEMNRDEQWWQELPEWRKWLFWNFRVGDNTMSVPMPFEWGVIFGALPMAAADAAYRNDPSEFLEGAAESTQSFLPSFLPTTLRVPVEVAAGEQGYDFFKEKPIVPFFTVVNTDDPRDRYNPWTPVTYRKIAEALGLIGAKVSPLKIEHVLEGFTGGLAGNVIETAEGIGQPSDIDHPSKLPVLGRFFVRDKPTKQREFELDQERTKTRNRIKSMLVRDPNSERAMRLLEKWNTEHPDRPITFQAGEVTLSEEND